jgi:hypothetical protein
LEIEKLKEAIDERRKWNMEHLPEPNLVNHGLVQALNLIADLERGDSAAMGNSMMAYSRKRIHEIANDPQNLIIESADPFTAMLEPLGYSDDVFDVIYPDGVRETCVETSVAKIVIECIGKAMLEKGTFTQEEYEDYIKDPYMENDDDIRLAIEPEAQGPAEIVPFVRKDA